MPPHNAQFERRIPENAPEEIKNAYKEMRSLRKDLNLELHKDAPDAAKAMEMLKKSEELHLKVREWEVKQILEGNAPKPGFGPRGDRMGGPGGPRGNHGPKPGPDGRPGPKHGPQFGAPWQGGCFMPPPPMYPVWTPWGPRMMPYYQGGERPMPGCHCGRNNGPKHGGHKPGFQYDAPEQMPAPQVEEPAPQAEVETPAPEQQPAEGAKL